jgi:DNA modification methylase
MIQLHLGDSLEIAKTLETRSVQTIVTSPPYWGLRDYGVSGQLGLERTPEEYVCHLVELFRELRRVLRDDGTLWLNLGDSFWGGKGQSGANPPEYLDRRKERGSKTLEKKQHTIGRKGWTKPGDGKHDIIKPKDRVGIPWRVAFALQADGWYLRSDIIWHKPNPMPESVTDRPTKAHEYIFLLSKSSKYYYDADAVREPTGSQASWEEYATLKKQRWGGKSGGDADSGFVYAGSYKTNNSKDGTKSCTHPLGRNRRSVWTVTTKPFKGAHFATFPKDLIAPCILAGAPVGGVVLDPFTGSGTTGLVSVELGRSFVGMELNPEYHAMATARIESAQAPLPYAVTVS